MHKRAEIKAAVQPLAVAALEASGFSDAVERVKAQRALPVNHSDFPVVLIYALTETAEPFDSEVDRRTLDLSCEILVQGRESEVDPELDRLSQALEREFVRDEYLGGLVERSTLDETVTDYEPKASRLIGAVRLTYEVFYYSPRYQPPPDQELKNVTATFGELAEDSTNLP